MAYQGNLEPALLLAPSTCSRNGRAPWSAKDGRFRDMSSISAIGSCPRPMRTSVTRLVALVHEVSER